MDCNIFLRPEGVKDILNFEKVHFISPMGTDTECSKEEINQLTLDSSTTYTFVGDTTVKINGQDIFFLEFI